MEREKRYPESEFVVSSNCGQIWKSRLASCGFCRAVGDSIDLSPLRVDIWAHEYTLIS